MATIPVDFILSKIASFLENEIALLSGVHDELKEIKDELMSMKAFLQDADRRRDLTEVEKRWVANVRDKAYNVEDIIDEFMYYMNRLPQGEAIFTRVLHQTIHLPRTLWVTHQMATKLRKIKNEIKAVRERQYRYGDGFLHGGTSSNYDYNWVRNLGESSLFFRDDDLVGIESDRDLLLGWLLDGEQQPQRTVISIYGMGGSGKTTLVANAYNLSQKKRQHFDSFAWITVFQTFAIEDLLRTMVKEFFKATMDSKPSDLSNLSYRELVETLVNYLEPKRYVVVLDDVWDIINLWSQIEVALPDGLNGSRILLTTRKEDIATFSFGVGSHFHHVPPLAKSEAWTLFCMKAFLSDPERHCPPGLETIAKELVEKCKGLPLAIVTLGGAMSSKKTESEWRQIFSSLNWELNNNPKLEVVKSILWLSFSELPCHLKTCFLYCCAFPEDYLIKRIRLIRLWMAEEFVEEIRGVTPEMVAENYLMDLIRRSMIQVVEWGITRKPVVCKMHDLMRELALSASERENFCTVYDGQEARFIGAARRLSVQANYTPCTRLSLIRSFLLFPTKMLSPSPNIVPMGFKLLRVLDLEDASITRLPKELTNLFNLRYLNLRGTRVKELPQSLGSLSNLQTLDISLTRVKTLPTGIVKLQNLRHLLMYHFTSEVFFEFNNVIGTKMPHDISKLKNLQVLDGLEASGNFFRQIRNMTQLTHLGITDVRESDGMELCNSIQDLQLLETLFVKVVDKDEYLRMDALLSPRPNLAQLALVGMLEKVPNWFPSLQSLTSLNLRWSRLSEDVVPFIQALPNLVILILVTAYTGKHLCFRTGFHKLVQLQITNFPELNEIIIEKGVMPRLENLYIWSCPELKTPPQGIEYLNNLQELNLDSATKELVECIRGELRVEGQNKWQIPKIISFHHSSSSGYNYERLS